MVLKPSLFVETAPQLLEAPYPEKPRVRAGVSIKGQAEGLTFYADRPRTSVSLSIAQREFVDNLLNLELLALCAKMMVSGIVGGMTAAQKTVLAEFLDLAAAKLLTGYRENSTTYHFEDDVQPQSGVAAAEYINAAPAEPPVDTLEKIAGEVRSCRACKLCAERKNAVPGEGADRPLVMVIGEGPGADEDATGRPFVGRAGQLLDKMLASVSLSREKNCFIANIVKCRPPGNRDPESDEGAACIQFLERQVDVLKPLLILSAGRTSAANLLQTGEGITRLRGKWKVWRNIPLLPTFHPSYLLRDESQKTFAWEDMKSLCRRLAELDADYSAETTELRSTWAP
jgi:DNA polymerase